MSVHNPEYLLFNSCKGGVGKSTCAANVAAVLGSNGHKTLLCDCNFDMRCLDLLLGVEDEVVCDLADVAGERIPPERAVIKCENRPNLCFVAAPYSDGAQIGSERLRLALEACAHSEDFEFVIIDTPGALVSPALLDTGLISTALIVANHCASSIRAADMSAELLLRSGIENQRLIINCFDVDGALSGVCPGINEIIDRASVRLGGIIPFDKALPLASERGRLAVEAAAKARDGFKVNRNTARSFENTAARLLGEPIALFDGWSGLGITRKIRRLLG